MSFLNFLKKNWFGILTVCGSLGVFAFAILRGGGFALFGRTLVLFSVPMLLLGFALIALYWLLDALFLHILLKKFTSGAVTFSASFGAAMTGVFYNALTPFASGGQPMQVYYMNKKGVAVGDALSVITVKSAVYQIGMVAASLIGLAYAGAFFGGLVPNMAFYISVGLVCNAVFIGFLLLMCVKVNFTKSMAAFFLKILHKLRIVKNLDDVKDRSFKQIDVFADSARKAGKSPATLLLCVIITMFQLIALCAVPYVIFISLIRHDGSLWQETNDMMRMMSANALINMFTAFIPMPGASGAAEGSFHIFFKAFFPPGARMTAVLLWRVITYYFGVFFGAIVCVWSSKKSKAH